MENRVWRASVVLPKSIEDRIYKMRQTDEFSRCSISEVLRSVLEKGLDAYGYPDNDKADTRPA